MANEERKRSQTMNGDVVEFRKGQQMAPAARPVVIKKLPSNQAPAATPPRASSGK